MGRYYNRARRKEYTDLVRYSSAVGDCGVRGAFTAGA